MYTYDDVLNALHDLELKNPDVLLNIPENDTRGKLKIPRDILPGTPDTAVYKHNKTCRECLLKCKQDGEAMEKNLKDNSRVYFKTTDKNNHCFYQSELTYLHEHINEIEGFNKYTAVHLKYQMLMHLIANLSNTELMKKIFTHAWFKIMVLHACPKAWILQFLHSKHWGDAKSMLGLIADMCKKNGTLINYLGSNAEYVQCGPYSDGECHADIYILYNGYSHYTPTGTECFSNMHMNNYRFQACLHGRF